MVVVYSGDSDRPTSDWEGVEHSPRSPATEAREAGPFLPARAFHRDTLPDTTLFDSRAVAERLEPEPEAPPAKRSESRPDPRHLCADPSLFELPAELSRKAPETSEPRREVAEANEPSVPEPPPPTPVAAADAASDARTRPTMRLPRSRAASVRPAASAVATPMPLAPRPLTARATPSAPPGEAPRVPGIPRSFLAGLLVLAACLAVFLVLRARSREVLERAPLVAVIEPSRGGLVAAVKPAPAVVAQPAIPSSSSADASPRPTPAGGVAAAHDATSSDAQRVASPAAAAPAASLALPSTASLQRVVLEVVPTDAKVFVRGNPRKGPPFTFDIGPGGSIVVEVVKAGYAARRVVLDGSKPELTVGLLRQKAAVAARPPRRASEPKAAVEPRSTIVRSGL